MRRGFGAAHGSGLRGSVQWMIEHLLGTFTPLLSAVPLPALPGGLRVSSLNVGTEGSYVVANGDLQ